MRVVHTTRSVPADAETVWQVLTDWVHMDWRGDLSSIRVSRNGDMQTITETLRSGLTAHFMVTKWEPPAEFEKYLAGETVSRRWGVTLTPAGPGETQVTLREEYVFKNRLLSLLSRFYVPIRAEQKRYLKALEARLRDPLPTSDQAVHLSQQE